MNYLLHYNKLIDRALTRVLDSYGEIHHIVPKCMGGSNNVDNLVLLLPEEHYVAHQLLIKIYPFEYKLANAAAMMCVNSGKQQGRSKNKLYGWLRKRVADTNRIQQTGTGNSQYGAVWMYDVGSNTTKKIKPSDVDEYKRLGWAKGRVTDFAKIRKCKICETLIVTGSKKTCSADCLRDLHRQLRDKDRPLYNRESEFLSLYTKYGNADKVLKLMGFPGNQAHWGKHARELISQISTIGSAILS